MAVRVLGLWVSVLKRFALMKNREKTLWWLEGGMEKSCVSVVGHASEGEGKRQCSFLNFVRVRWTFRTCLQIHCV